MLNDLEFSCSLEDDNTPIEDLEAELVDELAKCLYGQSANFTRLNTYGHDDVTKDNGTQI